MDESKIQNGRRYFTWQLQLVTYCRYFAQHMGGWVNGRPYYGKWADMKWQPQLSHKITTPELSVESRKSESSPPSLSHLWAPHADLSRLSCSQATPSLWIHNLHLCVGDRPAHWLVFAGSLDHMRGCGRSLCHSVSCRRRQRSVVRTVLD
jgi:hypothetical protein